MSAPRRPLEGYFFEDYALGSRYGTAVTEFRLLIRELKAPNGPQEQFAQQDRRMISTRPNRRPTLVTIDLRHEATGRLLKARAARDRRDLNFFDRLSLKLKFVVNLISTKKSYYCTVSRFTTIVTLSER